MRNLVQKYRPRTLDQLCGQPRVVDVLRRHLRFESRQALLLVGPSGTGKTTAARVVGAGIACERTAPEPCGACPSCNEILGTATANFNWYEVDAARFSDKRYFEHATRLLGSGHPEPWTMFLDELHRLDDAAADSLLKSVEEPGRNSRFIGATTELSAVRPALRKRCIIVPFLPMSAASSFGLLKEVCEKEGLRFEPTALDMIASASEGSARQALIVLDLVASEGDVTCQQVADALAIGTTTHLLEYFDGVIAADADAQRLALYNWQAAPAEKAQLIRAYLLQVYTRHIAPTPSSTVMDPAFYQISDDLQRDLVIRMKPHAGKRPLPDFWLDLLDAWEFVPAALSDHPALLVKVHRFHRMVHGEGLSLVDVAAATPSNARAKLPYRSRSMKLRIARPSGIDAAEYLSFQQAETLYDAASMIGQEYGLLFNTAVRLRHAGLGGGEELNAGRLVSQLLHELRLRMRSWVPGERLHWIYVHERSDAGVITELVLHVPPMALLSFEDWLPRRIANMCRVGNVGDAISIDAPKLVSAAGNSRRRVQRHWSIVRRLLRGIAPDGGHWDEHGRRVPLSNLFGVPASARGAIGRLTTLRRFSTSGSLGSSTRTAKQSKRMKYLSALADNAWHHLADGWELAEHADRVIERETRRDQEKRIEAEWSGQLNPLERERRAEQVKRLHETWPEDPRRRLRSWKGWW